MHPIDPIAEANRLLASGQARQAWNLLSPQVRNRAGDVNLQMTAGMAARACGEIAAALECFRRASVSAPQSPEIANILANTLDSSGRTTAALEIFARIVSDYPQFADAHINRAIVAQKADQALALQLVEQSLAIHPANARLWSIKGTILKALDRLPAAVAAFDRSLALDPGRALVWFNRGVTHRAMECYEAAVSDYREAAARGASGPQFDSARAAALLELGEVDTAERLYESAHRQGDSEAGVALARLRREYRDDSDPFAHFEAAAASLPGEEGAWADLLFNLLDYGEYERLREAGARARRHLAESQTIAVLAAIGEAWAGDRGEGIAELERLTLRDRENRMLRHTLAELHLFDRNPERAALHAQALARHDPHDQGAWAFLSTAWRMMDDEREFWLCDYDRFVMVTELVNDQVAATATAYATYLAEVLETLHVTRHAPGNQSLREGTQTSGALFKRPDPRLHQMRDAVLEAVRRAVTTLPDDPAHPFLSRKAELLAFKGSWSVRLAGARRGHHVSHFHGEGWISSAYYSRLPARMAQAGAGDEGCIHFGAPPAHLGLNLPPRRIVRPREGMMALFPSYMWHGTVPFSGEDVRMTAAFDVIPQRETSNRLSITI